MKNINVKMISSQTRNAQCEEGQVSNINDFKDINMNVDESISFNAAARLTHSSITKIQPTTSQHISTGLHGLKTNLKKADEDQKSFLNSSLANIDGHSLYSLVALPVSPMAEKLNQDVFVFDRGDNQSYDITKSNDGNLPNITPGFSNFSKDNSCQNSALLFHPLTPPPVFIDTSKPPPDIISYRPEDENTFRAVVEQEGFISLHLRLGITLDISSNKAIRLRNNYMDSNIALSSCATQMALVHSKGRLLQYGSRIEIQAEDEVSAKNAKMYPKGISFTANNCALVYLVDEAGARSTTDQFHDLYDMDIADKLFMESCNKAGRTAVSQSMNQLDCAQYWRSEEGLDCWIINGVSVKQTWDGLVIAERQNGAEKFVFKTSPNNGKVRLESSFVHVTASHGEESHLFVKSGDHRLHYNGQNGMFIVRNAGNAAGFDESGMLRLL